VYNPCNNVQDDPVLICDQQNSWPSILRWTSPRPRCRHDDFDSIKAIQTYNWLYMHSVEQEKYINEKRSMSTTSNLLAPPQTAWTECPPDKISNLGFVLSSRKRADGITILSGRFSFTNRVDFSQQVMKPYLLGQNTLVETSISISRCVKIVGKRTIHPLDISSCAFPCLEA
jgi:hypothetical protein